MNTSWAFEEVRKTVSGLGLSPGSERVEGVQSVPFGIPPLSGASIYSNSSLLASQTEKDKYYMISLTCGI